MKKIAFTLCSNNYLAHAKTLGDSIVRFNPDVSFVIGLTDKLDANIDYSFFEPHEVVLFDSIGFDVLNKMVSKYNIIEFNTSVKPFYFEYFFSKYGDDISVLYFDPDIECYSGLGELFNLLSDKNCLLTPHITLPQAEVGTFEPTILNVGVYNLGFVGIRNTAESMRLLKWWQRRLEDYCYIDQKRGLFVDQMWVNLVPVLFEGVHVVKSPKYNMACWNFGERKLLKIGDSYFVNNSDQPLVFFHFSGFTPRDTRYVTRIRKQEFLLESLSDFRGIFEQYAASLKRNKFDSISAIRPSIAFNSNANTNRLKQRIGKSIKFRVNKYIKLAFDI